MSNSVIKVENISKQYRLGNVGLGSLSHDLNRWWYNIRGKEDPYLKIGEENNRSEKGESEYVWALRDINFEVKQGEVLGIIGRNGAGKSTLLKILSRTTTPTTGEIKIKGRVASLLEVGTGFHPELTGRENIFLNGAILGMTKKEIKSKFDEIVDFSGVERYIDTPVKRYSSGMYVRLAFGVAAHLEPEILIVDEVLAVGDAEFQKKALGKMKDVSGKDGRTVLFVSHNLTSISTLCTSGVVVNHGEVIFIGGTQQAIHSYQKLFHENTISSTLLKEVQKVIDRDFILNDIRIRQEDREYPNFVTSQIIKIEFSYQTNRKLFGFRIGIDFCQAMSQTVIFRTFHDDASTGLQEIGPGEYHSELIIPSDLLRENDYEIKILVGIHNVRWISKDEIVYRIRVDNLNGINRHYADQRPGVIMPKIIWTTKNF